MQYRTDINGLRAIAVLSVIFYHLKLPFISGGFLGVDIFFVISGFLITGIILDDLKKGSFSFVDFYERRIRRIFPALYLVVFLSAIASFYILLQSEMRDFFKSVLNVSIFTSNIMFYNENGYFAPALEFFPLLHTWSLSVEEQFYFIIPIVMVVVHKFFGKQAVLYSLVCLLGLSMVSAMYFLENDADFAFYMLPTRMWELLVGGLGAYYIRTNSYKIHKQSKAIAWLPMLGLMSVFYALFSFEKYISSMFYYLIMTSFGTVALLVYANEKSSVHKILSTTVFFVIGEISYSLYLFHQPIISFTKTYYFNITIFDKIVMLIMMFILSAISWKYVEQHFRNKNKVSRKAIFRLAKWCVFVSIVSFAMSDYTKGYKNRIFNGRTVQEISENISSSGKGDCSKDRRYSISDSHRTPEICVVGKKPSVTATGDSHSKHLFDAMKDSKTKVPFEIYLLSGCPLVLDFSIDYDNPKKREACIKYSSKRFEYLNDDSKDIVVIGSYFINDFLVSDSKGYIIDGKKVKTLTDKEFVGYFIKTVKYLQGQGKRVILVSSPPNTGKDMLRCYKSFVVSGNKALECSFDEQSYSKGSVFQKYLFSEMEKYVPVIWLEDYICKNGKCRTLINNKSVYLDTNHLSKFGSSYIGKKYDLMGVVIHKANAFYGTK